MRDLYTIPTYAANTTEDAVPHVCETLAIQSWSIKFKAFYAQIAGFPSLDTGM